MSAARRLAPGSPEERIARAIAAVRADLEPDPLFERRLRSQVLGRYVAGREGVAIEPVRGRKEMGRLGRAVLYASFVLGVSVTSVMAASQQAVPGDALYPLKRDIEALRHRALPEQFEALLLRTELNARLDELAAVARRGDTAAVAALAAEVHVSYGAAIELSAASPQSLVVLDALLDRLPDAARAAVRDVVLRVERATHATGRTPGLRGHGRHDPRPGRGSGAAVAPPAAATQPASPGTTPSAAPEASSSPQARGSRAASPSATPDDQGGDQNEDE